MTRTHTEWTSEKPRSPPKPEHYAYARPSVWLPSDLAISCGIQHDCASPGARSLKSTGPLDAWNMEPLLFGNGSEGDARTHFNQFHLCQGSNHPYTTTLQGHPTHYSPPFEEGATIGTRTSVKKQNASIPSPPSGPSSLPLKDLNRKKVPGVSGPQEELPCTLLIERLDGLVSEEDIRIHFMSPPDWPTNHPLRRAYMQLEEHTRTIMPTAPAPFVVRHVRVQRQGDTAQAEVRFVMPQDCDRALVEMQHSLLTMRQMPQQLVRLNLTEGSLRQPTDRRGRVSRPSRSTAASHELAPSSPDTRYQPPNPAAERPGSSASSPPRVPTTLTFVEKESESKPAAPGLASALALAHASSALDPANTTVFVGSLFSMASEPMLYSLFSRFGPILSVNIPRGQDCGFVQFARKEDASHAITEMQNFPVAGGTLRLSWGRSVGEKAAARAATRAGLRWVEDVA